MNEKVDKKDPKNQNYFLETWLSDPSFKDLFASDEKSTRTRCTICHKVIELSSSGCSGLTVHASGKKHADAVAKVKNFFKLRISVTKPVNSTTESQPEDAKQKKQQTFDNISFNRQSTIAEIIWILKTVLSGHSMLLNDDLGKTFAAMFPQPKSLYNFNLARRKSMYVINHVMTLLHSSSPCWMTASKSQIFMYFVLIKV